MTNTPDLELRKRCAEAMGWTELLQGPMFGTLGAEEALFGMPPGSTGIYRVTVTPYETSLDAGMEMVEFARERGWEPEICGVIRFDTTATPVAKRHLYKCRFHAPERDIVAPWILAPVAATALCRAFVALAEAEGWGKE